MGGSGGGYGWYSTKRKRTGTLVNQAEADTDASAYNADANDALGDALGEYNSRDAATTRTHIETIQTALEQDIEGSLELSYGGSVQKHTYVDGLSDADLLVKVNDTSLEGKSPHEVLDYFAGRLRERLPDTEIIVGKLAVTVKYADGSEIQILPAVSTATGIRISKPNSNEWSNVIRPDSFAKKLTEVNKNCGGKVVPVIKLFKAVLEKKLPEDVRPNGYHAESLAIEAFESYTGPLNHKDMLTHLCKEASVRIKSPIADHTGQSIHVDDDFGVAQSDMRNRASSFIERLSKAMEKADKQRNRQFWKELFDNE